MDQTTHRGRCPKCATLTTLVLDFFYTRTDPGERHLRAVALQCHACGYRKTMQALEVSGRDRA